jgi:hypothetical protein
MEKRADFTINLDFMEEKDLALAGVEGYKNPLLTWVKFVFTDDKPNANKQGIGQDEFANLIKSMAYMPIKANFNSDSGVEGHSDATIIGVIKQGQHEANKILAIGALFNDEHPNIIEFFKKELAEGRSVDFSWEIRYKDSESKDGVEWLKGTTTKAVTTVKNPAYEGRTPLMSISAIDLIKQIDDELQKRGEKVVVEVK